MLDNDLAKNFINKVGFYTDYNVNIMDERGIIIASKTPNRIGSFHEIAFQIINSECEMIIVDNENSYIGVKEGVNMALLYKNKKIGVVGITGNPSEVKAVAMVIKMCIETMLEYELYKEERYQRRNMKEQFLMRILYREDIDENELIEDSEKIGLTQELIRIPIYISFLNKTDVITGVMENIRNGKYHSKQDIMCITKNDALIIFKNLEGNISDLYDNYKYIIGEYLSPALNYLRLNDIDTKICIGSFQNRYMNYKYAYRHCMWLHENIHEEKNSYYFYDYIDEYFHSLLPISELNGVFSVFKSYCDQKFIDNFVEVIDALYKTNYNSAESSKAMFVHKNTLAYRFNKIREALGINPMNLSSDREFTNLLSTYFKRIDKKK
jgi:carbohydrate diacid regulator